MIRLRRAATLALAGLLLAACGGPNAPSAGGEQTEIRVTVTNSTEPYVIPWLVGDDQGLFAAHGVRIGQIVAGQGGSTTLRNLVSRLERTAGSSGGAESINLPSQSKAGIHADRDTSSKAFAER